MNREDFFFLIVLSTVFWDESDRRRVIVPFRIRTTKSKTRRRGTHQKVPRQGPPVRDPAFGACVHIRNPPPETRKRKCFFRVGGNVHNEGTAAAINRRGASGPPPLRQPTGKAAPSRSISPDQPNPTQFPEPKSPSRRKPPPAEPRRDDRGRSGRRRIERRPDGRRPGPREPVGRRRRANPRGGHHVCASLLRQEVLLLPLLRRRHPPPLPCLLLPPRAQPRRQAIPLLLPAAPHPPRRAPPAAPGLLPRHGSPGTFTNGVAEGTSTEHQPAADTHQACNSGPEWVDLFVREMSNSSNMDDARARASRALEALTKSIVEGAGAGAVQSLHQENMALKEQMAAILQQNAVLKRAVAIQHERQKEYEERSQEAQGLKQLVLQYQEQLRTLEMNNYALQMHLKQAQQSSSMPGRYNPDVF